LEFIFLNTLLKWVPDGVVKRVNALHAIIVAFDDT